MNKYVPSLGSIHDQDKNPWEAVYSGEVVGGWYASHRRAENRIEIANNGRGAPLYLGLLQPTPRILIQIREGDHRLDLNLYRGVQDDQRYHLLAWSGWNEDEAEFIATYGPHQGLIIERTP